MSIKHEEDVISGTIDLLQLLIDEEDKEEPGNHSAIAKKGNDILKNMFKAIDNEDQSTMKANIVENYKALYREDADTTGLRLSKELAEALADFVSNYTGETLDMCSDDTVADLKEMSNKVARIEQELQDEKAKTDELNKTISENATKIQFLEAEDANTQSKNETLQSRIDSQVTQIDALEQSKSVRRSSSCCKYSSCRSRSKS